MTGTSVAEEAAILSKITGLIDKINAKTTELQNTINSKIGWLPGALQQKVIDGWNKFLAVLKDVWAQLREFLGTMGSPSTLWDTADTWSAAVGAPVSGQVASAAAGMLRGDDVSNWQGNAAENYRQGLSLHEGALDKIKSTLTDGISSALSDLAKGIIAFWVGLGVALAAFIGGMIGAIGAAGTIFGLPASPVIAVSAAVTAVVAFGGGMLVLKSVASSNNTTLRQKIDDNNGLDEGHWPRTVTA